MTVKIYVVSSPFGTEKWALNCSYSREFVITEFNCNLKGQATSRNLAGTQLSHVSVLSKFLFLISFELNIIFQIKTCSKRKCFRRKEIFILFRSKQK